MSYFRDNIERAKGYEPGYQPGETDVVKLNTNENPYPPSPGVLEAIRQISPEQLRRYPDPTGRAFRRAAGELNGVPPDWVICGNGGDELLRMAVQAFCDEQHSLAYPIPTYSLYPVLAGVVNCQVVEVPFSEDGRIGERLAEAEAALTILCNPNAPTGGWLKPNEVAPLAERLLGKGVLLVDEAYVDFAEGDCCGLVREFENVMVVRSLSKGYSLAGLRFGYSIAQPTLTAGLMKVKDSYNVDTVSIAAATAAIRDREYFRANVDRVKDERARLRDELARLGFSVEPSSANFILAGCSNCRAQVLYDRLMQQRIYVRYFATVPDKLRITVGTAEQNDKLLLALREIFGK